MVDTYAKLINFHSKSKISAERGPSISSILFLTAEIDCGDVLDDKDIKG